MKKTVCFDVRLFFLLQMLDDTIRQFISFVKTIPGFSQLSMKDQIRLIKGTYKQDGVLYTLI